MAVEAREIQEPSHNPLYHYIQVLRAWNAFVALMVSENGPIGVMDHLGLKVIHPQWRNRPILVRGASYIPAWYDTVCCVEYWWRSTCVAFSCRWNPHSNRIALPGDGYGRSDSCRIFWIEPDGRSTRGNGGHYTGIDHCEQKVCLIVHLYQKQLLYRS